MNLIDTIEGLGALSDAGMMTRLEAVRRLIAAFDGGLTAVGAQTVLDGWQSARALCTPSGDPR